MVGQDVSKISQEDLVNNLVASMMGQGQTSALPDLGLLNQNQNI